MIPPKDITGVVLAGGKSSRFGSNKALALIEGESFLQKAGGLLSPFCRKTYISGNYTEYNAFDYPKLPDLISDLGPMGGIYTALKQIDTPYALFLTCDMPTLTADLLKRLVDQTAPAEITLWKQSDGYLQLFPSLYHSSVLPIIEQHIDRRQLSMRSLFSEAEVGMLSVEKEEEAAFLNINRITDLDTIKHIPNE